jgi:hypothetical protein
LTLQDIVTRPKRSEFVTAVAIMGIGRKRSLGPSTADLSK